MDSLVKSKRDLIEVKNGYFKYDLFGEFIPEGAIALGHDCKFEFQLPPLNEMGFSDKYNQCLIRINKGFVFTSLYGSPNHNEVFYNTDGTILAPTSVDLYCDIPCRNQFKIGSIKAFGVVTTSNTMPTLHCPLYHSNRGVLNPHGGAGLSDGLAFAEVMGSTSAIQVGNTIPVAVDTGDGSPAGAGADKLTAQRQKNVWESNDSGVSIWDDGVLCASPMGSKVTFTIRTNYLAEQLCMHTPSIDTAVGNTTQLRCQLEIQLLPNPTPSD